MFLKNNIDLWHWREHRSEVLAKARLRGACGWTTWPLSWVKGSPWLKVSKAEAFAGDPPCCQGHPRVLSKLKVLWKVQGWGKAEEESTCTWSWSLPFHLQHCQNKTSGYFWNRDQRGRPLLRLGKSIVPYILCIIYYYILEILRLSLMEIAGFFLVSIINP